MHPAILEIDENVMATPPPGAHRGGWMHVVPHLDPVYGGLSTAVPQLASAVAAYSRRSVALAGFCGPHEQDRISQDPDLVISRWPASRVAWLRDRTLQARFKAEVAEFDGLHIHGLWTQSSAVAAQQAQTLKKPYVLSAHGMLDPWALRNKRLKKLVYAALTERANVRRADCLHALTHSEVRDYRRFGATNPAVVIPNGVSIPATRTPDAFLNLFPQLRGKRIVLFLSRIHYKKGLHVLVEAWRSVAKLHPEAHLVLAGPDFENTRDALERSVQSLGIADSVLFAGMLDHSLKWSAFAAAECFVLPSFSEGLSVAVLEAMGCGLPVVITEQCNLPEVALHNAGWTVQPTAVEVRQALTELLSNSAAANSSMGENGRTLVEREYSWPLIARKFSELYSWLEGGALPHSLELIRN